MASAEGAVGLKRPWTAALSADHANRADGAASVDSLQRKKQDCRKSGPPPLTPPTPCRSLEHRTKGEQERDLTLLIAESLEIDKDNQERQKEAEAQERQMEFFERNEEAWIASQVADEDGNGKSNVTDGIATTAELAAASTTAPESNGSEASMQVPTTTTKSRSAILMQVGMQLLAAGKLDGFQTTAESSAAATWKEEEEEEQNKEKEDDLDDMLEEYEDEDEDEEDTISEKVNDGDDLDASFMSSTTENGSKTLAELYGSKDEEDARSIGSVHTVDPNKGLSDSSDDDEDFNEEFDDKEEDEDEEEEVDEVKDDAKESQQAIVLREENDRYNDENGLHVNESYFDEANESIDGNSSDDGYLSLSSSRTNDSESYYSDEQEDRTLVDMRSEVDAEMYSREDGEDENAEDGFFDSFASFKAQPISTLIVYAGQSMVLGTAALILAQLGKGCARMLCLGICGTIFEGLGGASGLSHALWFAGITQLLSDHALKMTIMNQLILASFAMLFQGPGAKIVEMLVCRGPREMYNFLPWI